MVSASSVLGGIVQLCIGIIINTYSCCHTAGAMEVIHWSKGKYLAKPTSFALHYKLVQYNQKSEATNLISPTNLEDQDIGLSFPL